MIEDITDRQKPLYNVSPITPLTSKQMARWIEWQPRSRKLNEFPTDAQVRLRQLDFNRTITVCADDKALYVKRTGFNTFLWCEAD
jgi:hypothetical protein